VQPKRILIGIFVLLVTALMAASCAKATETLSCPSGKSACGDVCVDLQSNSENCGKCGTACLNAQVCVAGACATECPGEDTKCPSGATTVCVNTQSDNDNCGSCGKACNAGEICFHGACSGTCGDAKSGNTSCSVDGGAPYCANLKSDILNCGACGKTCSAGQICASGVCQGTCTSSQTQCGADAGTPYCADLQNDNANCGTCGNACSGALSSCENGTCSNLCGPLQKTCTTDGGTFCADTLSDNKNCGACGTVCSGSTPVCLGGKCSSATGGGTVRYTNGTITNVTYVPCGNGTNTNCTEPVAETSCTNIGLKLVSHASNGTSAVVSLGATISCEWDISYFTNNNPAVAGQCLIGVSNAQWSSCCGTTEWHGNIVTVPTTLGQQFGYVYSGDSGYNAQLSNVSGTTWGCQTNSTAPPARSGCTTYYVACM
jgi:hypothetical protein